MKNDINGNKNVINELKKIKKYSQLTEVELSQVILDIKSFCEIIVPIVLEEFKNSKEERRYNEK